MTRKQEQIKRLISSLQAADELWERKAALLRPGELACRPGCFGCCVGLFAISLAEGLALRSAVSTLAPPARESVLERAATSVRRTADSFPGDAAAGLLDPERSAAAEDAWLVAVRETACPALELPSGRCAVYAARPTTCRTYGLALHAQDEILLPACELNLPGATPERVQATAIDAARLAAVDQSLAETAAASGLPAGVETTVAHALTGTAFEAFAGRRG